MNAIGRIVGPLMKQQTCAYQRPMMLIFHTLRVIGEEII
jgi:hypothetical protein